MLRDAAGRGQHFQDRFSTPRKVTCHQSCHIFRNITRHIARQITLYITRQMTLQRTRQITRNITGKIPCQITRHITRQKIIIIISRGFMATVAISYQVAITFSKEANLRLSLQHFYSWVALSRNKKIIRKPFSV